MTQHFITAHMGRDHISSDDARVTQIAYLGDGRHVISGMQMSIPNSTTLHVSNGLALVDGGWYRISGGGVDLPIANGSIGMNRRDAVFLVYTRMADNDSIEDMHLEVVTGTPVTGNPAIPQNPYPGELSSGDATVWILFAEIYISGLTVSRANLVLGKRTLAPPAQQCAQCDEILKEVRRTLSDCLMATARALEVVRSVPADLAQMRDDIAGLREWLETEQAKNRRDIQQLAAMLANNIAAYVMVGDTLAAPSSWIEYDSDTETVQLAYTSYDEETGELSIDTPLTVDKRVEAVRAEVDYLLMISGEE